MNRKRVADALIPLLDFAVFLFVIPAAILLKLVRRLGLARLKISRSVLLTIGVLPVRDHYYEPFIKPGRLMRPLDQERSLPGINMNTSGQLEFLAQLTFESELGQFAAPRSEPLEFRFGNQSYESGDAEFLYQIIRKFKPKRLFEIGSGQSTLVARTAIAMNVKENPADACRHVCIEPFEARWLESTGVEVRRERVEDVDVQLFLELERNDLLFIDSSHVIRPQGDVLTEYLAILPLLKPGVVVHVHDIFTPRDYLKEWVIDSVQLWNEQYILEAFLTNNEQWTVIGAVNWLKHNHFDALRRACPYLTHDREPGSFYIQRN